jgi:predicted dehydrogenase/nucleoside-diphosphate-sugar epimerase
MARQHLGALTRVRTGHVVVGVHDLSPSRREEFAAQCGAKAYATLPELLASASPDIVHVCTPAGRHFEVARTALLAGSHVYVEKPFVETREEADALLALAAERGRLICAGHQLLKDRAFVDLLQRANTLQPVALIDSHFAFRPMLALDRASPPEQAAALLDILPHPLYTLISALEQCAAAPAGLDTDSIRATPLELHARLQAAEVSGRLFVSLRARPIASSLTISGAKGTLTTDFVRGVVIGAGNEGTGPLEKIVNPFLEAGQGIWRTGTSLMRRLLRGESYPGLAPLLEAFYSDVANGSGAGPVTPDHLRRTAAIYEELAARLRAATERPAAPRPARPTRARAPVAVLTGARGFLGREVARELAARGFRVRGIGRSPAPDEPHVDEWVRTDLSQGCPVSALSDARVVVHAAAATSGGWDEHRAHTIAATKHVMDAMQAAGVRQLVYVSSLSTVRPPVTPWERQDERTPVARAPRNLGAYTWGKCLAEDCVTEAQGAGRVDARILRPAALIDWRHAEFPGLLGRRLFGRWHLGFGRPGLPLAVMDVRRAAAAVAWCAAHFDQAPRVVNLMDHEPGTRRDIVARFRAGGWDGRIVWVPISAIALLAEGARIASAIITRRRSPRLAVWSVLRPRRFDDSVSQTLLRSAARAETPGESEKPRAPRSARITSRV